MSRKGQLLRGEKWYNLNRDINGDMTKELLEDSDKMVDVKLFLEAKKKEDETKSKGKK